MIITDKREKHNEMLFGELNTGDIFEFDGDIFMKMSHYSSTENNALDLGAGVPECFAKGDDVVWVTGELIVTNK